jgi:hypothetical protein
MFILDSLMIAGIRWALETTITAAEAEMNDDSVLREQLIETELRREMGEISDQEFEEIEADLLKRIREIKHRRDGGSGPLEFGGAQPLDTTGDNTFQVEASVSGDFYDPADAPHTTVVETDSQHGSFANLVQTSGERSIEVLDMEPGDAHERADTVQRSIRSTGSSRSAGAKRSNKLTATSSRRTGRTARSAATTRTSRTTPATRTRSRTARSRSRTK